MSVPAGDTPAAPSEALGFLPQRSVPAVLGVLVAVLFAVTGASWAVASPPGASPDEPLHLASIWCAWGQGPGVCEPTGLESKRLIQVRVPDAVAASPCFAGDPNATGACLVPALASTSTGLAIADRGVSPKLFYATMRLFVGPSVAVSVVAMRLVSVLLGAVLLGLALAVAGPLLTRAVALAWLGTLVPLGIFLVASVNPSGWTLIGVGTFWAFLLRVVRRRDPAAGWPARSRAGTWLAVAGAVVAAALAVGSRGDGAGYVLASVLVVLALELRRWRDLRQRWVVPLAAVVVLGLVVAATSLQVQALAGIGPELAGPNRAPVELLVRNVFGLPDLFAGALGYEWGLGALDTPLPGAAAAAMPAVYLALLVVGLGVLWRRKAWVATGLIAVLIALPLWVLQARSNLVGENVQPRYLLPLMLVLLGIAALGRADRPVRLGRYPAVLVVLVVAGANAAALHTTMRRYLFGLDSGAFDLDAGYEWWWDAPVQPMTVFWLGSLAAFGLAAALMLAAARDGRGDAAGALAASGGRP